MQPPTALPFRLLILDGDDTLWQPVDGICCSDRTVDDAVGWSHFTYQPAPTDPDLLIRDDGVRFRLTPGARAVLHTVTTAGGACALASFNHRPNIERALTAWGIRPAFAQVVAHWHTRKDEMLREILEGEEARDHPVTPAATLFVDDDPEGRYRAYAARLGVRFLQMGVDIQDLWEVLTRRET
jgi:predicted phosphatase